MHIRRLLGINGVSLAFALIANIALLVNMSGRGRFEITQPVTVVGFLLAAALLIALVGVASTRSFLGDPALHALTQAFYYAIWAAAIYLIIALLMAFTIWGAIAGKYERRFNLTTSQRTLMLQTISFMAYLLIGALIFSTLEHWQYLDAVFWANFTLLTIGLGSPFVPTTHAGRSLLFPYAIGGIITVGLVIGSIRAMLLEAGKQKMRARATEKQRSRVRTWADALDHRPGLITDSKKHSKISQVSEKERRRLEFHGMRRIQTHALRKSKWTSLAGSTVAACVLWFIGALVFMNTEYKQGWSYFQALYFSFVALLTIGYGDLEPYSNSGKSFFVLWSLLAVPTLTVLISDMGDTVVKGIADVTNYLGTLTILPSEEGVFGAWRAGINNFTGRPWMRPKNEDSHGPEAILAPSRKYDLEQEKRTGNATRMLRSRLDDDDFAVYQTFSDASMGDDAERHRHFYRWILSKEIGKVLVDKSTDAGKQYTYDEWAYFLLLLGHKEDDADLHSKPNATNRQGTEAGPKLGQIMDSDGRLHTWSWLGIRSPLMSPREEAEYILHHLLAQLQRELNLQAKPGNHDAPPVNPIMLQLIDVDGAAEASKGEKTE